VGSNPTLSAIKSRKLHVHLRDRLQNRGHRLECPLRIFPKCSEELFHAPFQTANSAAA
jgi:hypothetical protein